MPLNSRNWLGHYLKELQLVVTEADLVQVHPQWRHHQHLNTNHCFYFILDGEGWIEIDGESYSPEPGQLFLLPEGSVISYTTSAERPFRKYYCHFHATIGAVGLFQLVQLPHRMLPENTARIHSLFSALTESFHEQDPLSTLRVKALMHELLYLLMTEQADRLIFPVSPSIRRWNEVLAFMERHMGKQGMTIEQIALRFHFSPKYFIRSFKSAFGITPHQHIHKLRMDKAKLLLRTTDLSLEEIASAVGMERTHFSRMFKQYTHFSPQQYRRISHEA